MDHIVTPSLSWSGRQETTPSASVGKIKNASGMTRLFDDDGRLTIGMTKQILARLECRKYLEESKLNLLIVLLKVHSSACARSMPEQTFSKEIEARSAT